MSEETKDEAWQEMIKEDHEQQRIEFAEREEHEASLETCVSAVKKIQF